MIQVVWFKRDLRIHDHRPLARATQAGSVLPLYVVEPELWAQPDRSHRHWRVTCGQLIDLDTQLSAALGLRLAVMQGSVCEALAALHDAYGGFRLLAHEETGTAWTYRRDLDVIDWCREYGVAFEEIPQFGVFRRLRERDGWSRRWQGRMEEALTPPPSRASPAPWPAAARTPDALPSVTAASRREQLVGRCAAVADLDTFLRERGDGYRQQMSSPLTAESGCSRLSVHLALGTLSMREVWQSTRKRIESLRGTPRTQAGTWLADLKAFEGRLHWHCHFIQKLESQPSIEWRNLSRACDGLREERFNEQFFDAWRVGETGYPYIDACMRYLRVSGWINFRARAMLMSFAAYDLWLHWPEPARHLAQLFTDYEPGIHYSQVQMQSGTTGINTLRIYNPVKQGLDHDPEADFIATWVPELARLAPPRRHEPWRASPAELTAAGVRLGVNYPERVVDHATAARAAQSAINARRRQPDARVEAAAIHHTHGSRRRS
jgi:deoxyribodipyrimidine photo-lyase